MKIIYVKNVFLVLLLLVSGFIFSQEKSKKELRLAKKMEQELKINDLMATKKFQFVANRAFPMGYRSIDLVTNPNYITFSPEVIKSELPFFGRATGSLPYGGGDGGIQFEGVPEYFTLEKNKKGHELKAQVKGKNDSYTILLTIYNDGGGSLIITSNNKVSISYSGTVSEI